MTLHGHRAARRRSTADSADESKRIVYGSSAVAAASSDGARRGYFKSAENNGGISGLYGTLPGATVGGGPLTSDYGTTRMMRYGTATYGHLRGSASPSASCAAAAAATLVVSKSPEDDDVRTTLLLPPNATPPSLRLHQRIHRHHPHHQLLLQDYGYCAADTASSTSSASPSAASAPANNHSTSAAGSGSTDEGYDSRPPSYAVFFSSPLASGPSIGSQPLPVSRHRGSLSGLYEGSNTSCDGSDSTLPVTNEISDVNGAIYDSCQNKQSTPTIGIRRQRPTSHFCGHSTQPRQQKQQQAVYFVLPSTQTLNRSQNKQTSSHVSTTTASGTSDSTSFPANSEASSAATASNADKPNAMAGRCEGETAICDLTSTVAGRVNTPIFGRQTSDLLDYGVQFETNAEGSLGDKVAAAERPATSDSLHRRETINAT